MKGVLVLQQTLLMVACEQHKFTHAIKHAHQEHPGFEPLKQCFHAAVRYSPHSAATNPHSSKPCWPSSKWSEQSHEQPAK
eukprot:361014-Chlamydomonas_euryale.AAC.5